ncbi:valine--tRNA ligase, partial [Candidatus Micrarchaeota archaeon]|nr:valine--tRNA ligase [Candidatus Micrarchaeota archaeon]
RFDENDEKKEIYSIDTPPPFTSGELHMGHVLSYSFFDFVARYKRMRGFNVYYPQGWDTQGFPTEVRVEKKFGRLPPEQFREKCVEWTKEFIAKMKEQMDVMGFSPDWKYEYRTMDPEYHKKIQRSLIQMYNEGHLYRAEYPVHWCPHCISAIAKAELDDLERDSLLNYIKFLGPDNEELVIATTRPEFIPACVALMFNPLDERYRHLAGKKARTALGAEIPLIAEKDVEKEFGTGLMMLCTFGDKTDVVWAHRYELPFKNIINQYGKMQNTGLEGFDGLKIVAARKKMIEKLKEEGKLVKQENLKQSVKVHDRCGTPVEFIISMQWFADIKKQASRIKEFASKIQWVPEFGINYLTDWVDNVDWDWVISRQRIFGTPIPFYYCEKCGKTKAAEDLPYYAEKAKSMKCDCGEQMIAEKSTCDCWVDSSITPLIIAGWPDDEKMMKKVYPSSLRPQGVEIVRTWAFYTIYRSGMLTGKPCFETILLNGNVLAPDGKKMSKSLGNVISPQALWAEYPTDSIRQWAALSGAMAKDRPFSYEDLRHAKSFLSKVWNSTRLAESSLEGYTGEEGKARLVDKWIISRMNELINEFTAHMEKFEFHYAMSKMQQFYWNDLCDNYLEYIKHRIYGDNDGERKAAQHALRYVVFNSVKLLAPITPHISEEIWKEFFKEKQSVHLSAWPEAGAIDSDSIAKAKVANEIVSLLRKHKAANKKAMNSKLGLVRITAPNISGFEDDIKGVMKIEKLEITNAEKVEILEVEFAE